MLPLTPKQRKPLPALLPNLSSKILANSSVPSAWTYFLSVSAVNGVGLGVAAGNIDGFALGLRMLGRGLMRPTESERSGAERFVLDSAWPSGGEERETG